MILLPGQTVFFQIPCDSERRWKNASAKLRASLSSGHIDWSSCRRLFVCDDPNKIEHSDHDTSEVRDLTISVSINGT